MFANIGGDLVKGFPTQELLNKLEPFLRDVVRDEVQRSIELLHPQSSRPSLGHIESSRAWACQLQFVNNVPSTLFTGNKVESEDGKPIKVVIREALSNNLITSGPLSSVKIEILVLDGDFGSNDQDDWSEDEFKANLVREREGKKPLLVGELRIALKDGVGDVGEVAFTDNSSWIRGRKFRLGARIAQGTCNGVRVREARSEAFVVKDHRGESYKKHHPPAMKDETWRLENIAKDGAFHKRLAGKGIFTVGDFTRHYHVDPKYLRDVLGGLSDRTWDIIIKHAVECVVDETLYAYSTDTTRALVFNSVFKVVGVIFNGQNYRSLDKLSDFEMGMLKNLKAQAYKNVNAWFSLDGLSAFGPAIASSTPQPDTYSSPSSVTEQIFPSMQQDQLEMQSVLNHITQPSFAGNVQDMGFMETTDFAGPYAGDNSQISQLVAENSFSFSQSPWEVNNFFSGPCTGVSDLAPPSFSIYSRSATPRARWRMIKAALTWGISVRRDVAAKKKMARPFYPAFVGCSY